MHKQDDDHLGDASSLDPFAVLRMRPAIHMKCGISLCTDNAHSPYKGATDSSKIWTVISLVHGSRKSTFTNPEIMARKQPILQQILLQPES